ncbi:MAG: pyridoxamine 5'-phosphate oxidase [Niastella sp. SCN 39-18]|nr:pyridoxamine 5'-phosphate oxidase [Sphingobacteriales bacterium]ODT54181.1 MAG: pyridoxamine 5'-phosphate oxidase [Niastella sp. SCN 39-18]OJW09558.1 MAG: pyridoxamine 5'-phosphate oxidase [Sphingobacteriales bacterium 39-19]
MNSIADIRKDYKLKTLDEQDVDASPIKQFKAWWAEAEAARIDEVNAMALSTVDAQKIPHCRIVLLKGVDDNGFIFYTNYESEKAQNIAANAHVSLLFFWKELERQVRITGLAEKVSAAESDEYFNSRPPGSRIGAWASPQSTVIPSREMLDKSVSEIEKRFAGKTIERPPHWGGYRVIPSGIEFWQGRPSRLHDRIKYTLREDGSWKINRLAP